jgi:hypothetical protein
MVSFPVAVREGCQTAWISGRRLLIVCRAASIAVGNGKTSADRKPW